ncbi:hypothetical protein EBR21_07625, partial [bacterium]|nr:hypothetical protein [bacterium]
ASRSKEIQYGDVTFLCAYQSAPLPNNAPEETADMVKYLQKSMSAVSEPMRIGTLMKIRDESKESVKYSLHGALIALALAPDASKSVLESVNNLKNSMIELKFTDGLSEEVVQAVRKAGDNSHAGSLIAVSQVDFGKLKSPYTIVTSLATSANYYPYNDQIYMVKDRKFSEAEFAKAQYRGPKCDDMKAAMIRDVR